MQAELYWIDGIPQRLAILPAPRGAWLAQDLRALRKQGVDVLVSLLTDEEKQELFLRDEALSCRAIGVDFVSFPIADRSVPEDAPGFRALVARLRGDAAAGKGVAVHCRGGVGRSAVLLACVLAGLGHSVAEAFRLIRAARGCRVPDTEEQREWVERSAGAR